MKTHSDLLDVNYVCPKIVLSFDLAFLLKRKGLQATLFEPINCTITLNADISEHAAWVFKHIYAVPYSETGDARLYHGIQHASRTALYALIFANLYRRHGHHEAMALSQEAVKLIQIALLFHDSAREGDDEDCWDHESAAFLYFYLTRIVKISSQKAKKLAEAVANKDWVPGESYLVLLEMDREVVWSLEQMEGLTRTINHKLIHDSDCLDVIRARDVFKGKKLNFYQEVVSNSGQKEALNEMAELIIRARSLIEMQGDGSGGLKPELKKRYENENAFVAILQDIANGNYIILEALYAKGELLPSEQLATLTLIDESNLLNQQRILARGMITPTAVNKKNQTESFANLEFRKVKRRLGVPTNTSKANGIDKEGNPNRSVSLLGSAVFADVGCLLFNPEAKAIKAVYAVDADTGWGKKQASGAGTITLDRLEKKMKKGGGVRFFEDIEFAAYHNEILCDIKAFDAIYYTYDPTFAHAVFHGISVNKTPNSAILKAIYLQLAYKEAFNGTILPIYEYSGIHHYLKEVPSFSEKQISDMWFVLCKHFMIPFIEKGAIKVLMDFSINDIMIYSLYGQIIKNEFYDTVTHGCGCYPEQLVLAIEKRISDTREALILSHQQTVKATLASKVQNLLTVSKLTYEISQQFVQAFKSAIYNDKLSSSQIMGLQFEMRLFLSKKLKEVHRNRESARDDLFNSIYVACGIGVIDEFKTQLSKLEDCRWFTCSNEVVNYQNPLSVIDLVRILNRFCLKNGKIDLAYLTLLEISYDENSQIIFLNAILPKHDLLRKFFIGADGLCNAEPADISTKYSQS